ncbi:uncharacterized protein L3040_004059 [Drepanopeziza brunnea f. sp. 'multigermtubi']|uniref:uncharacterized protein n=1 Tax=Drepanopeziza brunnea f. sp. 'multigermtubi' TaxID=698441 RepID=UPI00239D877A|nr:hypothetical protein L3040_004059 [Drepanopeziza brunnea f. sp. 'multigermtubi']
MDYDDSEAEPEFDTRNEAYEDRDTIKKSRQALGLTRNYVPTWTGRDAFRELFQNWMDGMIEAQGLDQGSIKIVFKKGDDEWVATAHPPGSEKMIGFIRFLEKKGTLELSNFGARLQRKALDLGVSSKRTKNNLAGTHGEGFKVASLVLVRKGYQVRYESSKAYWNFGLGGKDKSHLYCHISPMKDSQLTKRMLANTKQFYEKKPRGLISNIWEDVCVKIGKVYSKKGLAIDNATFMEWIKVSFVLCPPTRQFKTPDGDLVLDKPFGGRLYLKGLYIGGSASSKVLKFGYNLSSGQINRDRQILTNSSEEATSFARMWGHVIREGNQEALKEYTKMLLEDDEKHWADVNFAKDFITKPVAAQIWTHLLTLYPQRDIFFYRKQDNKDFHAIKKHLPKEPISLPTCVWDTLRKYHIVRTPEEYRHDLLHNAPGSSVEETPYSAGVKRALSAALALDERTKDLKVIFKQASKSGLELLLDENDLLISDTYLDFAASHRTISCYLWECAINPPDFPCDHIIVGLYETILHDLKKGGQPLLQKSFESNISLRQKLDVNLRQMPRIVELIPGKSTEELMVSWTDLESNMISRLHGLDMMYKATLHKRSICSDKQFDLIFQTEGATIDNMDFRDRRGVALCGCPFAIVSQKGNGVVFPGLDSNEEYFPMVSRYIDQAFYGVPPVAILPTAKDVADLKSEVNPAHIPIKAPADGHINLSGINAVEFAHRYFDEGIGFDITSNHTGDAQTGQVETKIIPEAGVQDIIKPLDLEVEKLKTHVKELSTTLQTQKRELNSTSQHLQSKEQELVLALETLENKEMELRQAKAESEAEVQRLLSLVEDLRGENQQLYENEADSKTETAELTTKIQNLHAEIELLRGDKLPTEVQNSEPESQQSRAQPEAHPVDGNPTDLQNQAQKVKQDTETTPALHTEIQGLKTSHNSLQAELAQIRNDRNLMIGTLETLSNIMQGALRLPTRENMVPLLQNVLDIMQTMINSGSRMAPASQQVVAAIKRERQSDEGHPSRSNRLPKRQRTRTPIKNEASIDLTDSS